jgi:uncharacterized damage-inducible protein DinB
MIQMLFDHMEWADGMVWRALGGSAIQDERLHRLTYHLHATQRAFLQVWNSVSRVELPPQSAFADLAAIREWASSYYAEGRQVVLREDPARTVTMPWADHYMKPFNRRAAPTTFEETVIQITSHSTYHRGQINARLRELGVDPPLTDFIAWLWLGKPHASV